jgi:anti-sigma factor RsiW
MLYLDSEGDPELHLHLRNHIGECPACAQWFAQQQQLEKRISDQLSAGNASPDLWGSLLTKAGLRKPSAQRRRWPAVVGGLAAAAMVLLALVLVVQSNRRSHTTELTQSAAEWHEQWQRGNVRPDFASASDQEVDRYLKAKVPFRVHCPPRTDVNFTVQGAGVCLIKNQRQAAYIVGHVGKAPVSILVLDRASVEGFPQGGFHHCKEGGYQVASGIIAGNVVVVVGTASPDILERLLHAYGSYHEG